MSKSSLILRGRARHLRRNQTDAERKLWMRLRGRQVNGFKFRRQHPIGRYVVDFCCPDRHLVVEVDGGQHAAQISFDGRRTEYLVRCGYRVLRYWDHEVLQNIDAVLEQILEQIKNPHPHPLPERERA